MTMSVNEQLLHMTVRIECSGGSGTGFIFDFCRREGKQVPAIVTNKHVVEGGQIGIFYMTVAKGGAPQYGKYVPVILQNFEERWVRHPDPDIDLAVLPIAPFVQDASAQGTQLFYKSVSKDFLADATFLNGLRAMEDIIMIGYPNNLWDAKNNLPIARRGVTATPPWIDFEGRPEFMIDCACFPGSSGSPIVVPEGPRVTRGGGFEMAGKARLLGILWAGPQFDVDGEIKAVPVPTTKPSVAISSSIPIHLGYCIKADQLLAFEDQFDRLLATQEQSRAEVEPAA